MNTKEAVANRIIELCRDKNISINSLANQAGGSPTTIKSILNGESQNPGIVTIKKLCDGFNITLGEFFSTKEFNNLEQELK